MELVGSILLDGELDILGDFEMEPQNRQQAKHLVGVILK